MIQISIITPSYNQAAFIEKTFISLLEQHLPKGTLQYILVDALSNDGTDAIVSRYISKFKEAGIEFTYISEKDGGQSDAINKGLKLATGEIVTYINSDDYYEPDVLNKVLEYFHTHPLCFWAFGGWNIVNKVGVFYKKYQPSSFSSFLFRSYSSNIGQPSCFWRKKLTDRIGGVDESLHLAMDYDLWLRFLKKTEPHVLPFVVANLRYYSGAKSGTFMLKHNWQAYTVALKHAGANGTIVLMATIRCVLGYVSIRLGRNISQQIENLQ